MIAATVEIQIEELHLIGFSAVDHKRLRAALVAELNRLFAEEGIPPALRSGSVQMHYDGGAFPMLPAMSAEQIGQQIAQSLYRVWTR